MLAALRLGQVAPVLRVAILGPTWAVPWHLLLTGLRAGFARLDGVEARIVAVSLPSSAAWVELEELRAWAPHVAVVMPNFMAIGRWSEVDWEGYMRALREFGAIVVCLAADDPYDGHVTLAMRRHYDLFASFDPGAASRLRLTRKPIMVLPAWSDPDRFHGANRIPPMLSETWDVGFVGTPAPAARVKVLESTRNAARALGLRTAFTSGLPAPGAWDFGMLWGDRLVEVLQGTAVSLEIPKTATVVGWDFMPQPVRFTTPRVYTLAAAGSFVLGVGQRNDCDELFPSIPWVSLDEAPAAALWWFEREMQRSPITIRNQLRAHGLHHPMHRAAAILEAILEAGYEIPWQPETTPAGG